MDVSSTNNIVNTVVATMVQEQSVAINVAMLKKSMDMQASASAALLQMLIRHWPHRVLWGRNSTHLHEYACSLNAQSMSNASGSAKDWVFFRGMSSAA